MCKYIYIYVYSRFSIFGTYDFFPNAKLIVFAQLTFGQLSIGPPVRGPRSTVHGPQSTVHGPRSTVHGPRSAVRGPRCEVQGPRSSAMVHGAQRTVHGRRSAVPGPRPAVWGPRSEVHGPHNDIYMYTYGPCWWKWIGPQCVGHTMSFGGPVCVGPKS